MTASLRAPLPSDYATISTWINDAQACARWAGPLLRFPFTAEELATQIVVPQGISHCLGDEGASPLAFGQYWLRVPGCAHLGRIIVAPSARGRGLGKVLCSQLIDDAIDRLGVNKLSLRVYRDNTSAMRLYASLGFAAVDGESSAEVLFMEVAAATVASLLY
jgi:ribosomal protein S18 acetylase RimI-like enzyme